MKNRCELKWALAEVKALNTKLDKGKKEDLVFKTDFRRLARVTQEALAEVKKLSVEVETLKKTKDSK